RSKWSRVSKGSGTVSPVRETVPDPGYLFLPAQLRQQRVRAIYLRQRLADDRRVHGHRAVLLGVEPVRARDRVDIAVEHQAHDLTLRVDERAARVAADDVV